ncbi:hypothetical protein [Paenibacillus sp. NEAU-GSW1]|uniref:DUF5412 family protein n=1 Tax=Paenibacillus sp. NEAU-GSW1 TaxID=2682486 RepID=UPI0012E29E69|nr:hypothetical protein [Paenibacillus sp. NEAU-GSW1]MUT68349.1 hypothetical protein [Paenibacillus sp. NEAU-GSW1]
MKLVSLLIIALMSSSLFLSISGCSGDLCSNEVVSSIESPNKDYRAYVFLRDCGATTKKSYQVSVLKNGKELKNSGGNVFSSYNGVSIFWSDTDELTVSLSSNHDIFTQETKLGGIEIKYD